MLVTPIKENLPILGKEKEFTRTTGTKETSGLNLCKLELLQLKNQNKILQTKRIFLSKDGLKIVIKLFQNNKEDKEIGKLSIKQVWIETPTIPIKKNLQTIVQEKACTRTTGITKTLGII